MLVPYWNNVMNPYWDPLASGITVGWSGVHGRAHFYRAILEGIAYEQRLVGDAMMAAAGQRFTEYVGMGGGSRSRLWLQIMADVTGVPVVQSTTNEATCLGASWLRSAPAGMQTRVPCRGDDRHVWLLCPGRRNHGGLQPALPGGIPHPVSNTASCA